MGRQILFTSQKGGVGKSTLARSLAVALAVRGRRVLLADFDADQGTCLRWRAQREARDLSPAVEVAAVDKMKQVKASARRYDDVVVDTAGRLDNVSLSLAAAADAVLLPSSYSPDDILPTLKVIRSLREAGVAGSKIAIVFCRTGGSRAQEVQARSVLAMNDVAALDVSMPQKDGYVALFATGRTGRESPNPYLRRAALAVEEALADFVDEAAAPQKAA